MTNTTEDAKFSLKVLVNKSNTKVIYAEADSDFSDVLLSFLTLPLGTIVRILGKHYEDQAPVVGSLTTLYNSLQNLNANSFWTESGKQMLLNPRKSFKNECCELKLNVDDTQLSKAFVCGRDDCSLKRSPNFGLYYDTSKCDCGKSALSKDIGPLKNLDTETVGDGGVYTKREASFIISDDLQVLPSETRHALRILTSVGITGTDGTELRDVSFGFNEVMDLLKGSLLSQTPLTDLILKNRQLNNSVAVKCETGENSKVSRKNREGGTLLGDQIEKHTTPNAKKMTIKAIMQESTNRLLHVESDGDFVDFLFSLLTIPLGGVEHLLGGSTTLQNVDNLYGSLTNIDGDKYLKSQGTKSMLLEPEIPDGYISKSNILPLKEECYDYFLGDVRVSSVKSPKGPGNYVKGQKMFMVTDDLIVTPLCMTSSISIINRLRVPLSDVKEVELEIRLKEALGILKASLTSTLALTDGLMLNPTLEKRPKQEEYS